MTAPVQLLPEIIQQLKQQNQLEQLLNHIRQQPPEHQERFHKRLKNELKIHQDLTTHTFRGAAQTIQTTTHPETLLSGPAGTGKSLAALHRLYHNAVHYPGTRALIVRKTAKSLTSSALVTWRTKVAKNALDDNKLVYFYGGSAEQPAQYRFVNGSKIMIGGMDNPDKIMSSEYDLCFAQEAIELTENDWEAITTRLRNGITPWQQIIGDTNPSTPTHWLKTRCDRGQTQLLESRHEDNPHYYHPNGQPTQAGKNYIQGILDNLTGVRHKRLRLGLWVAAEGIIYEQWDPHTHIIQPHPIPPHWPRHLTIDYGYRNPFVCQWWAQDPDDRLILYREYVQTQTLVEDHAKTIQHHQQNEPPPHTIICDHDLEDTATLQKHLQHPTTPAKKTVTDGIQAVQSRLKTQPDGKPRILVFNNALTHRDPQLENTKTPIGLTEEIQSYIWAPTPDGKTNKEQPHKKDDHSMDALRYIVAHLDLTGTPNIRWL